MSDKNESFVPELRLIKTLWGVEEYDDPTKWEALFTRIKKEGFQGVEVAGFNCKPNLKEALDKAGLFFVYQVHTSYEGSDPSNLRIMTSRKVSDHVESFRKEINKAKDYGALFANCHSGCDSWTLDEARDYLRQVLSIEKEVGITVSHETHRVRLFWNPFNFRDILKGQNDLKDIKITLDISHWVVCLERVFGHKSAEHFFGPDDDWWPEVLEMLKERVHLIHARVGYGEGPQVPDPAAPEYVNEVEAHLKNYWSEVLKAYLHKKVCFVEPEHGPWPYQQSKPFSNMAPCHDIWKANNYIKDIVSEHFNSVLVKNKRVKL